MLEEKTEWTIGRIPLLCDTDGCQMISMTKVQSNYQLQSCKCECEMSKT